MTRIELNGTRKNDKIYADPGYAYILYGYLGNDRLYGAEFDDWLDGGEKNDKLYGDG